MENRLFPTWEQLNAQHNPLTEGEIALLKFLDFNLPKDNTWNKNQKLKDYKGWLIFAQPFLNGSRPDIVIFNPQVGLVIYEVKDWNLENYEKNEKGIFVYNGRGWYPVEDPINQVQHYKEKLIGQLVPIIGEKVDKNGKNFGLVKTGIYFHKSTTKYCREKLGGEIKDVFKSFPFFGYDYLKSEKIKEIVPDIEITSSYYWDRRWNEEILFWLLPPYHSIEQGTILRLKGNQAKIAEPQRGHFRVRGVAGSGKTQALAYRAGHLASQGFNVLVISYNITLWHYIKDMIARAPFNFSWGSFTFVHFHGFCRDKLIEFGKCWPESNGVDLAYFFKATVPDTVMETIEGKKYQKYDAILIDEGQDYHFEWYHLLSYYFLTDRDELLIVADKKQNIFDRELDWLDKRVTRSGLEKFVSPYIDLTLTFRLPQKVAIMTNEFSDEYKLNQDLKVGKVEETLTLLHSHHIIWINIDEHEWQNYIYNAFLRLKKEEYSASDIVILLPNHKLGMEAVQLFKVKGIEVNHVFEDDFSKDRHCHKKAFWMGDGRLKMSTIHSFKGWELLNIVLFIPSHSREPEKNLDMIVYTAMTRTRENLIVLNSNDRYKKFGEKLPKKWDEQ